VTKQVRTIDRRIGIDFGTSTTVLCYLDFVDGEPQMPEARVIDLEHGSRLLESIVYDPPKGGPPLFGSQARAAARKDDRLGALASAFKMDLLSAEKRTEAEKRMRQLFGHLRERYEAQRGPLRYGEQRMERTFVSFPAKWPPPLREATISAAKAAMFPDVHGIDEPSAAMQYFLYHDLDEFRALDRQGVIRLDRPVVVLLVDMGAGTSDFVLYKTKLGSWQELEILSTWPAADGASLGGREIDGLIASAVTDYLKKYHVAPDRVGTLDKRSDRIIKYKELVVSPMLARDEVIQIGDFEYLDDLRRYGMLRDDAAPYRMDRTDFGNLAAAHFRAFLDLVEGALRDAIKREVIRSPKDIDLVLLTGGHSQWYFVHEALCGNAVPRMPLDRARIDWSLIGELKTGADTRRLLTANDPQTIVARGLVVPVDIEPVAANNLWYRIEIEIGSPPMRKSATILVVHRGEVLPIERKGVYRLELDRPGSGPVDVTTKVIPVVGMNLETGERFVEYSLTNTFEASSGDANSRNCLDLYLEVTVTKEEQVIYTGLLAYDATHEGWGLRSPNRGPFKKKEGDELWRKLNRARTKPELIQNMEEEVVR
jgi:molecular chaperone DnaK (HSP70)